MKTPLDPAAQQAALLQQLGWRTKPGILGQHAASSQSIHDSLAAHSARETIRGPELGPTSRAAASPALRPSVRRSANDGGAILSYG